MKIVAYTALALIAFAGNSVLCRMALGEGLIDAASFTVVRLLSGMAVLALLLFSASRSKPESNGSSRGSWQAALALFVYALTFSYAYITLDTGTGALILFACVQLTMILREVFAGNKLHRLEILGVSAAFAGLVYLVLPTVTTPSVSGFVLMAVSGVAWGAYSLLGKASSNPLADTAYNFLRTAPLVLLLTAMTLSQASWSQQGILLAVLSGALMSGVGYAIWYSALQGLTGTQAAVLQLLVPVIAAVGGVVFYNEVLSLRLVIASMMILGGVLTVILGKQFVVSRKSRAI